MANYGAADAVHIVLLAPICKKNTKGPQWILPLEAVLCRHEWEEEEEEEDEEEA